MLPSIVRWKAETPFVTSNGSIDKAYLSFERREWAIFDGEGVSDTKRRSNPACWYIYAAHFH